MGDACFKTILSSLSNELQDNAITYDIKFCENIRPAWRQDLVRNKQLLNGIGSLIEYEEGQGNSPVAAVSAIIRNRGRNPTRSSEKGLVASLQAVYEPPSPAVTVISGKCWFGAKLSSPSSFSASSPSRMLARPWQKGLYGSETASSNPPLLPKPTHLVVCGNQAPADYFSSSRSLSASGGALSCLLPSTIPAPENSVVKATSVASGLTKVNHISTNKTTKFVPLAWPTDSLKKLASEVVEADMVEDRRTRNAPAFTLNHVNALESSLNSKMKTSAKGTAFPRGLANFRDHNEDEELQYGPGIVNKLKSRYLSRTLRERPLGEPRRSSLRRAASLEDWLDKDISSSSSPIVSPRLSTSSQRSDETKDANAVTIRSVRGRYERPASLNLVTAPISSTTIETTDSRSPSFSRSTATAIKSTRSMSKTRSVDSFTKATLSVSNSDLIVSLPIVNSRVSATNLVSHEATLASPKTPVHFPLSKDAIVIVEKSSASNAVASVNAGNNKESHNVVTASFLPPPSTVTSTCVAYPLKSHRSLQTNSRCNVDNGELPAPDTVRQVKRIFESGSGRKLSTRRSQSAGPGLNRVPLSAANHTVDKLNVHKLNKANVKNCIVSSSSSSGAVMTSVGSRKQSDIMAPRIHDFTLDSKPIIIAKPSPIGPKPTVKTPKPVGVLPSSSYVSTSSSPLPSSNLNITPASTERVLKNTIKGSGEPLLQRNAVAGAQGLEVKASPSFPLMTTRIEPSKEALDEKDEVDRDGDQGTKVISKTVLDNIRKESTWVKFNFEDIKDNKLSLLNGTSPLKQVGIIRPQRKKPPAILSQTQDGKSWTSTKEEPKLSEVQVDTKSIPSTIPTPSSTEIIVSGHDSQGIKAQAQSPPLDTIIATTTTQPSAEVKNTLRVDSSKPTTNEASSASKCSIVLNEASQSLLTAAQSLPKRIENTNKTLTVATAEIITPESQPFKVIQGITKISRSQLDHDSAQPVLGSALNKESKKNWHQQSETSTVFNFLNDNKVVDHIRNESGSTGILLYKPNDSGITKLPDYDPGESSDFIDDLDILKRPPSPCNVDFEGANVIVGKSLIRRHNSTKTNPGKLCITFNDAMTMRFEYPSESSFLEEESNQISQDIQSEASLLTPPGGVALSNYTPSKVPIETTFELGVSRPILMSTPLPVVPSTDDTIQFEHIEDYLKPAEEATAWSAETTSDLLF